MCYTREHILSNIDYVSQYNIKIVDLFQLSMTCQHGVIFIKHKFIDYSIVIGIMFFKDIPADFPQVIHLMTKISTIFFANIFYLIQTQMKH